MRIKCEHCDYIWDYTGISVYAQCPRCQRSNSLREEFDSGDNGEL